MSEFFFFPSRQDVPAIIPPLLSFTAGFIDSFTVLALFGLFVAQVTGSSVLSVADRLQLLPLLTGGARNPRYSVALALFLVATTCRWCILAPVTEPLPEARCLPGA